jgi:hypothetical protein
MEQRIPFLERIGRTNPWLRWFWHFENLARCSRQLIPSPHLVMRHSNSPTLAISAGQSFCQIGTELNTNIKNSIRQGLVFVQASLNLSPKSCL